MSSRVPAERKAVVVKRVMALSSSAPEVVGRPLGADSFALAQASRFEGLSALLAGPKT